MDNQPTILDAAKLAVTQAGLSPDPDSVTADSAEFATALLLGNLIIRRRAGDSDFQSPELLTFARVVGARNTYEFDLPLIENLAKASQARVRVEWQDSDGETQQNFIEIVSPFSLQSLIAGAAGGELGIARKCSFYGGKMHLFPAVGNTGTDADYGTGAFSFYIPHYPAPEPLANASDKIPRFISFDLFVAELAREWLRFVPQKWPLVPSFNADMRAAYDSWAGRDKPPLRRVGLGDAFAYVDNDVNVQVNLPQPGQ